MSVAVLSIPSRHLEMIGITSRSTETDFKMKFWKIGIWEKSAFPNSHEIRSIKANNEEGFFAIQSSGLKEILLHFLTFFSFFLPECILLSSRPNPASSGKPLAAVLSSIYSENSFTLIHEFVLTNLMSSITNEWTSTKQWPFFFANKSLIFQVRIFFTWNEMQKRMSFQMKITPKCNWK